VRSRLSGRGRFTFWSTDNETPSQAQPQSATISLATACRATGISVATALKLMPHDFPEAIWIGGKRVVSRRRFEIWLASKLGNS
jgi:hypothetical protein